jgi:AcrR family transcriptional regulator
VSPRARDPRARVALLEVGARLLATEGPQALTARRIAAEVGCSTTPLYSNFGGMRGLVRSMVHEGFTRMQRSFEQVPAGDDPVAGMARLGRAYRRNAQENPYLYAVMFGGSTLGGFSLSERDRRHGRYTLAPVIDCADRCIEAGRFTPADPVLVAQQMWVATHGLVAVELGRYLVAPYDADVFFEAQLASLMIGAGDSRARAEASVRVSRAPAEVAAPEIAVAVLPAV